LFEKKGEENRTGRNLMSIMSQNCPGERCKRWEGREKKLTLQTSKLRGMSAKKRTEKKLQGSKPKKRRDLEKRLFLS